jgi:hypothetical protein
MCDTWHTIHLPQVQNICAYNIPYHNSKNQQTTKLFKTNRFKKEGCPKAALLIISFFYKHQTRTALFLRSSGVHIILQHGVS